LLTAAATLSAASTCSLRATSAALTATGILLSPEDHSAQHEAERHCRSHHRRPPKRQAECRRGIP
jgi:hypothetical protein